MSAEFLTHLGAHIPSARLLEQVDVAYRLVDKFSQGYQRVARPQRGPAGEIWTGRREVRGLGRGYAFSPLAGVDFGNTATVFAKVGSDIMLPIAARDHAFDNCNLTFVQRHPNIPFLKGQSLDGTATPVEESTP